MAPVRVLEREVPRAAVVTLGLRRVRLEQIVEVLPLAAAVFSLVGFVVAAYFRITFPYPMWVMETPTLQAIRRIATGQPLYAPPSLDYVAPIYAPLYFYVSALFAHVLGFGLSAPRLISFVASLGCAALVGYLVWGETRRAAISVVAAGLFVSATSLSSFTLDLARVDPLCLFLLMGAIACARAAQRRPASELGLQFASGALTGLAILTKQTAIAMAAPLLLVAVLDRSLRRVVVYALGVALIAGLGALLLNVAFGRWADYFLVLLPSRHSLTLAQAGVFWSQKILPAATLPLLLGPLFLIGRGMNREYRVLRFWLIVVASMLGMSWVATMNQWSDSNVLLPAYAVLAIVAGIGFVEVLRRFRQVSAFRTYAFALLAIEFVIIAYNPRESSPLRSDVWGVDRLVSTIGTLPGRVFAPDFPELSYQAGKGESAFGIGLLELTGGFGGKPLPESSAWIAAYRAALDQRAYDVLLLDPDGVEPFITDEATSSGYVDTGPLFKSNDVFYTYGSRYAPKVHVWLPKERVRPGG